MACRPNLSLFFSFYHTSVYFVLALYVFFKSYLDPHFWIMRRLFFKRPAQILICLIYLACLAVLIYVWLRALLSQYTKTVYFKFPPLEFLSRYVALFTGGSCFKHWKIERDTDNRLICGFDWDLICAHKKKLWDLNFIVSSLFFQIQHGQMEIFQAYAGRWQIKQILLNTFTGNQFWSEKVILIWSALIYIIYLFFSLSFNFRLTNISQFSTVQTI